MKLLGHMPDWVLCKAGIVLLYQKNPRTMKHFTTLKSQSRKCSRRLFANLLIGVFAGFSSMVSTAQEINYKVISDDAKIPKMQVFITPIDVKMQDGLHLSVGSQLDFRPIQRLGLKAQVNSAVITNPYRLNDDGTHTDGFKKMGGLTANVVGEFNWRKKGLKYSTSHKKDRFLLEESVSGNYKTTKYIPYDYSILMERCLRAGFYYDNFAISSNTIATAAVSFGIGKKWHRRTELDFGSRTDFQNSTTSWSFDVLYGGASYTSDTIAKGDPFGARLVLERNQIFSKRPGLRGFNFNYQFEVGFRPGTSPPYLSARISFPLFTAPGNYIDDVTYKSIERPRKFLGKLFRAL